MKDNDPVKDNDGLQGSHINFKYSCSSVPVLNNFKFKADFNRVTAIIGRNGCGKSTLFQILIGALRMNKGALSLNGTKLTAAQLRTNVGYCPQEDIFYKSLTVKETLDLTASMKGEVDNSNIKKIAEEMGIWALKERFVT